MRPFPFVREVLLRKRAALLGLALLSLLLGTLPAMKPELEAGAFDQINFERRGREQRREREQPPESWVHAMREALGAPLERFNHRLPQPDWPEQITAAMFRSRPFGE